MKPVAYFESDFEEKFGIPRQSGVAAELTGRVVFTEEYANPDYVRGIEGFSHLWLIWEFSEVPRDRRPSPTVRPPRLGGNTRVGVFATRSPFRPNPVGLSSVRLVSVEKGALTVSGADLMNGTPILDIKPYLAYTDSHPEASGGFTAGEWKKLSVAFPPALLALVPEEKQRGLIAALENDPRPSYQEDPERIYRMRFAGFDLAFRVREGILEVLGADPEK